MKCQFFRSRSANSNTAFAFCSGVSAARNFVAASAIGSSARKPNAIVTTSGAQQHDEAGGFHGAEIRREAPAGKVVNGES